MNETERIVLFWVLTSGASLGIICFAKLFYDLANIKIVFVWYDLWIGFFWDSKKKWLYFFPIPMFGLIIKLKP